MNHLFINTLILLFIMLFLFNLYNANKTVVENMEAAGNGPNDGTSDGSEYKEYKDDPGILAQQNAGNIKVLRDQVDKLLGIVNKIQPKQKEMTDSIKQNAVQINAIMQGKQDNITKKTGMNSKNSPDKITGLD